MIATTVTNPKIITLNDGRIIDLEKLTLTKDGVTTAITVKQGKVRNIYDLNPDQEFGELLIHTSGRQSAHNRTTKQDVPDKGAVLNKLSEFWFNSTKDIVSNHMLDCPRPDMMLVKKCKALPIEMIVRGYLAKSSTKTSLYSRYIQGQRDFTDFSVPDGLKANEKLPSNVLTPTTKDVDDENVTHAQIVERGLVDETLLKQVEEAATKLFARGQEIAVAKGLLLVDTKYEFGLDEQGNLTLIDELHTPDSSRFWEASTYTDRLSRNESPQAFDKEGIRDWMSEHCSKEDLNNPEFHPDIPADVMNTHANKYRDIYKRITGKSINE